MSMKKKDIIQYLNNISAVMPGSLDKWSKENQLLMVDGTHSKGNVSVSTKHTIDNSETHKCNLCVQSNGGNIASIPLLCNIVSPSRNKHHELWKDSIKRYLPEVTKDIPHVNLFEDDQFMENCANSDISDSIQSENVESNILKDILTALQKVVCYTDIILVMWLQLVNHLLFLN